MTFIMLFSFILLAWTHLVGIGASDRCIMQLSLKYSNEAQYCSSDLDHFQSKYRANVCDEIMQLFDEICLFYRSDTPFSMPETQNVSKENCVIHCADINFKYILSVVDISNTSCTTLCTVDPGTVAVLLTSFQLRNLIADLKQKGVKKDVTVKNSTPVQLPILTSKVAVEPTVSEEPDVKSSNSAAGNDNSAPKEDVKKLFIGNNDSAPKEDEVKKPNIAAGNNNSAPKEEDVKKLNIAAGNDNSAPKEDVKKTNIGRASPLPTKSDRISTTTDAGEMKTSPTKTDVKLTTKAAGENYSKPIEPATTTAGQKGKGLSSTKLSVNRTTTVERNPASTGIAVMESTEMDEDGNVNEDAGEMKTSPTKTDVKLTTKGSNKSDEKNEEKFNEEYEELGEHPSPGDGPRKTGEKDETSKLDDTPSSYHFLIYFLAFIVLCVAAYIVFHNKHKIIAFIIEGKQGRRGGRPSTKQYTPLKSKVEDVMPFIEKSTTQSNYIY
ncbi:hypothetical protein CHS0354_019482 [Potamilus streckersoni]|uniref:Trans-Golgi network integral membrane protein 2 n=1 Tax=Potamilus streckersoni TaxID=2493646 RepID=A0AAE0SGX9_9BIVA|nr:hypothetical protein CHS0354_019482 [Potamilus streckersoni]